MKKLIIFLTMLMTLAGCSSDKEEMMVVPMRADISSLSPLDDISAHTKQILRNMNKTLYKYNTDTDTYEFDAAKNIEYNGNIIEIELKPGILFHDGTEMKAEDVAYSLERLAGLIPGFTSVSDVWVKLLDPTKGAKIDIIDDYNLRLTLNDEALSSSILYALADCYIVPAHVSEEEQKKHPIGAGPYKFVSYTPGDSIIMEAFEDYSGDIPEVKKVQFKLFSDINSEFLAFKNGEVDMFLVSADSVQDINSMKNINKFVDLKNDVNVAYMNFETEPFDNIEIRQAFNYGIDRERVNRVATFGIGETSDTHMSKFMKETYNYDLENTYDYNLDLAKELMEKNGYNEDNPLRVTMTTVAENVTSNDMAMIMKDELSNMYVDLRIEPMPWDQYKEVVYTNHNFEMTILQLFGYSDPYEVMAPNTTGHIGNLMGYSNPEYDRLMNEALNEYDIDKRNELFKSAQQILVDDAVAIYLGDQGEEVVLSSKYDDYVSYPFPFTDISHITVVGE